MRRLHFWTLAALLPAAILLAGVGCNGKKDGDAPKDKPAADTASKDKSDDGEAKPVVIKTRGTLKGKVTLPSPPGDLAEKTAELQAVMKKHKDGPKCMAGSMEEISQQSYRIGEGNGLADVFVWLAPPDNHYYQLDPKVDLELHDVKPGVVDIKAKEVVFDQPHCAFIPHAFALFPKYNDGKSMKPTGQKLIVKNSADFQHNTNWKGGPRNPGDNKVVQPKEQLVVPPLNPDRIPVMFKCDIHSWMQAASRVFDHPFVAVTDKDGVFEIKDAPAGVDLQVIAWHPAAGFLNGDKGEKITLKDGMTETKNFEAKAK